MDLEEIKKILLIAALKNAAEFEGKPDKKAVMGKLIAQNPDLRSQAKNIIPLLDQIILDVLKLSIEQQKQKLLELSPTALDKKEAKDEKKELPALPNVDKVERVVMRMAPYPSGALHIGNARMIVLNDEYVKKYKGKLILFYDDTIGSPKALKDTAKAKFVLPEAYDLIKEGLEWLGVKYSEVYYKSERLPIYYEYCEKLINDDIAYVCFCSAAEFKDKYKNKKKDCPHRNQTVEKNLEEWKAMLSGKYHETQAVVRIKTGMDYKDPALRDQIIMRISEAEHPRIGTKYSVWPMLEFSWAIDDHLIGATHILRGVDLIKEDIVEEFVWDHFKWKKAEFLHYGKINFPDLKLSKTEARTNLQKGMYVGWEDPRIWSMQALKKRGIRPEALREALLDLGMSQSGISFSVNWLYAKNKAIIDNISNRYFYVENPIKVEIDKVPFKEIVAEAYLLPEYPEKGKRKIKCEVSSQKLAVYLSSKDLNLLKKDQIIRLKDLLNAKIVSVDSNKYEIKADYHSKELDREYSIIHWVLQKNNIKVKIFQPDGSTTSGFGEINLLTIPMNQTIQFERYGFVNPIKIENNELYCWFTH